MARSAAGGFSKAGGPMHAFRQPAKTLTLPVAATSELALSKPTAPAGAAQRPAPFVGEDPMVLAALAAARAKHGTAPAGTVAAQPRRLTPQQATIELNAANQKLSNANAATIALQQNNAADLQRFTRGMELGSEALAAIAQGIGRAMDNDVARARIAADLEIARARAKADVDIARINAANAGLQTQPVAGGYQVVVGQPQGLANQDPNATPPQQQTSGGTPNTGAQQQSKSGILDFVKEHPVAVAMTATGIIVLVGVAAMQYMKAQEAARAAAKKASR
jgi:hypothetical protein